MLRNLILPASFQSKACRVCRSCRICRGCRICRNCRGCQVCRSCRGFLSQPGLPDFSCSSPDKRKCLLASVSPQICEKQAQAPTGGKACWPPFHLRFAKNKLWPRQEEMPAGRISPQICEKHALTPTRGNASRPRFTSDLRLTCAGPDKKGHFREERKLPGRAETPGKR